MVENWKTEEKSLDLPYVNSSSQSCSISGTTTILTEDTELLKKLELMINPSSAEDLPLVEAGISIDNPVSKLTLLFGDSWSDPCIEFVPKTLIGDLPALDNTSAFHECSHHQQQPPQISSTRSQCLKNYDTLGLS